MGGYLANPLAFVVNTLGSLYILAVMLRFLLQWTRADFYNPISQALVKITSPLLRPIRRVVPGFGGIDIASIVLMIVLQALLLALLMLIYGVMPRPAYLLLRTPAELISLLFNLYIIAIIVQAILSWVSAGNYHPGLTLLYTLTEPVLRPLRQLIPPIGGLDLSPLAAIILLQVLKMLVMPPLNRLAPPIM
jgi:YggT family protein